MPSLSPAASVKPADEKITINLGVVDLGQVDLLVREGFYSNRSDLIRTAVRNLLATHASTVERVVSKQMLVLGLRHVSAEELHQLELAGETLQIRVLGLLTIATDVTPALARSTIEFITVLGAFRASPAVRTALADRLR